MDQRVGRTFARKLYPADSAFAAPHAADQTSSVASRRDILVERRPRNADRLADFVNCMFLLTVQIDGHGTLLFTKRSSPSAFPAPRPRRGEPGVRPFADQVSLKLRQRRKDRNTSLAPGVIVSTDSVTLWNPTRSDSSSAISSIKCLSDRPSRSCRQTASTSPDHSASSTRSRPGRCTLPPLTVSSMILSQPARFRASRCKSRFCSVVETLA